MKAEMKIPPSMLTLSIAATIVTPDVARPVQHAVPRSLQSVRLSGVGVDNRHRNTPLRRDQIDQATTSIALPLTRVSPFKLSTVT